MENESQSDFTPLNGAACENEGQSTVRHLNGATLENESQSGFTSAIASQDCTVEYGELTAAFERFVKSFSMAVSGQLCTALETGPVTAVRSRLATAHRDGAPGGCVIALGLDAEAGSAYLLIDPSFAGWAADVLLGAPLSFAVHPREILTELDLHAIEGLLDIAACELKTAFAEVCDAPFTRLSTDSGDALRRGNANAEFVLFLAELRFAGSSSRIGLLAPARLKTGRRQTSAVQGQEALGTQLRGALGNAVMDVQAVLKGADMRFGDLLRLSPGMVMALPRKAGALLDLQVNGLTKFHGEMVRSTDSAGLLIHCLEPSGTTEGTFTES